MTARDLIELMSPTTLASLIVDIDTIHQVDAIDDTDTVDAYEHARQALVANVGEDEAAELLSAAGL